MWRRSGPTRRGTLDCPLCRTELGATWMFSRRSGAGAFTDEICLDSSYFAW